MASISCEYVGDGAVLALMVAVDGVELGGASVVIDSGTVLWIANAGDQVRTKVHSFAEALVPSLLPYGDPLQAILAAADVQASLETVVGLGMLKVEDGTVYHEGHSGLVATF